MSELPEGWGWSTVGKIASVEGGVTPKGLSTLNEGDVPFFKVGDMHLSEGEWMRISRTMVDGAALAEARAKLWPEGTIVFPKNGGAVATNKKRRLGTRGACDLNMMGVLPSQALDSGYLAAWFQTVDLSRLSSGSVVPKINRDDVCEMTVPVPPLREQRRIVAAIEEHFSRLDAAESGIRQSMARLDRLAARALSSALSESGTWPIVRMGEIAQLSLGKMLDQKQQSGLHPTPYLRNINVRWGRFDLDDLAEMDIAPEELERATVRSGDLVMCEGGEPGRCAVWRSERPIAIQKALHRIRLNDGAEPEFVSLLFRQLAASHELDRYFTGSTIKHLPKQQLARIEIALPPVEIQRRCVIEIETLESDVTRTRSALQMALARSAALRRSVLAGAFSGHLVQQDPSDEPARVLLERIAADPAATKSTRKKKAET